MNLEMIAECMQIQDETITIQIGEEQSGLTYSLNGDAVTFLTDLKDLFNRAITFGKNKIEKDESSRKLHPL